MKKGSNIIDLALKYYRIVILIVIVFVAVGVYGLYVAPKQDFPTFTIRQGLVVAAYPGLTSSEIEEQLTKPLENFIFEYKEINKEKTFSQSKDGVSIINIELNENIKDKDAFWSKFKHNLEDLKSNLPDGVVALKALDDFGETSAILITIESEDKTYRELQEYSDALKDKLRKVDGVSGLKNVGLLSEQIVIRVDQDKLKNYGINNAMIIAKLQTQGYKTYSGEVKNSHLVAPIHIESELNWEKDVAEQIIYSDLSGNIVRLKDIAEITREYPDSEPYIQNNGVKCILLSIEMRKGVNVVEKGKQVNEILDDFRHDIPKDVKLYSIADLSKVVDNSVNSFLLEMLIAVIAVVIVVIAFMPMRVALVSAITIPITIFSALAMFYAFGIELNTIILSALIVTLGMVVDDSIVIIDNYVEKLDEGEKPIIATAQSPRKYFKSVLTATLVISVTFFPFLLTTKGMFNDFLITYPWAMTIILGFSLLIALLFTPFMQYTFIKKGLHREKKKGKNFLDIVQVGYDLLLSKCFKYKNATLLTGVLIIAIGAFWFFNLPLRLMPFVERDQFAVEIFLPNGKSIYQTTEIADSLDNILRKDGRVVSVTSFVGLSSPRFHDTYVPQFPSDNFAQFIVNTSDKKATKEILDEYSRKYSDYFPEAYIKFKQMDFSEARYPVEIRVSGEDILTIKQASETLMAEMKKMPELLLIRTNFEENLPGVSIRLNQNETNKLGIDKSIIAMSTALELGDGFPITNIWEKDYPVKVILKSERKQEESFSNIGNVNIPTMGGMSNIPLRQIASISPDWNEGQIVRRNGVRTLSILAEVERGYNEINITNKIKNKIDEIELPEGIKVSYGGMKEADGERLPQIVNGLLITVCLMLFILIFHFKKIALALLTLGSTMLCLLGTSIGMQIMGSDISVTSILGVVSLMGILLRNGIIMLDYAEVLRKEQGLTVEKSAIQAGSRRMRPIFLTSTAAAVGVIPMVIGGSPLWTPLGSVIFFGTLITMVFISTILPVAYSVIFKFKDKELNK
ncbi:efflux RND transporter permease subunit [uncultured Dysgonomonas sp.]|uniref:Acriflavin resistance protein n=2 Tax=Dysgonomonas TaxID=156973 RepID=A0A212JM11_9BACT|nr:efflux RND transporter permease subunit [uncultured Dysgonomonas sp.]SBW00479.1 conserved membrane hypothetical protein [uncultured Dysgonomonas sp.]